MLLVWLPLIVQGLWGLHCNTITGWKGLTVFLSWHMMLLCDHLLLSWWILLLLVLRMLVLMWRIWSLCLKSDRKIFIFECGSCPFSANEQIIRYNTVSSKRYIDWLKMETYWTKIGARFKYFQRYSSIELCHTMVTQIIAMRHDRLHHFLTNRVPILLCCVHKWNIV